MVWGSGPPIDKHLPFTGQFMCILKYTQYILTVYVFSTMVLNKTGI